jgi:hypothetical protein
MTYTNEGTMNAATVSGVMAGRPRKTERTTNVRVPLSIAEMLGFLAREAGTRETGIRSVSDYFDQELRDEIAKRHDKALERWNKRFRGTHG